MLQLRPGERVLLPGVGTGLDLPLLPAGVEAVGIDSSPEMLEKARARATRSGAQLELMDAARLGFEDESFDAVLFSLVLSAVPDGRAAFREGWRVLRPGGRAVIFDVLAEDAGHTPWHRRARNLLYRVLGGDHLRHLKDIVGGVDATEVERSTGTLAGASRRILLGGRYTVVLFEKKPLRYAGAAVP